MTTHSLEALKKLGQCSAIPEEDAEVACLEEVVSVDTSFAMAYRNLSIVYANRGERGKQLWALTKAFANRERLTDLERHLVDAAYHSSVTGELDKAIAAYRRILAIRPDRPGTLNNLANVYLKLRDFDRAEELYRHWVEIAADRPDWWAGRLNLAHALFAQGEYDEAERLMEAYLAANVDKADAIPQLWWSYLASARGDYESAETRLLTLIDAHTSSPSWQARASLELSDLAAVRGRLGEARRHLKDALAVYERVGHADEYIRTAVDLALIEILLAGSTEDGLGIVAGAVDRYPLDSIGPFDRPYLSFDSPGRVHAGLVTLYASAGQPERARALLTEYNNAIDPRLRGASRPSLLATQGLIALAEGRTAGAIDELRRGDFGRLCIICVLPHLGRAYELNGEPDSALAVYERYVETPYLHRVGSDAHYLAWIYERLGWLHEEKGKTEKAIHYYGKFVDLWKDADPELQPRVEAARRAMEALSPDS